MNKKGYKVNISEDRFVELCKTPHTDKFEKKAIFETKRGLESELKGIINNLRRPENPKVNLDFVAERAGLGEIFFMDHKEMIDHKTLAEKGQNISVFPTYKSVAWNIGKSRVQRYISLDQGPRCMADVIYIILKRYKIRLKYCVLCEQF